VVVVVVVVAVFLVLVLVFLLRWRSPLLLRDDRDELLELTSLEYEENDDDEV